MTNQCCLDAYSKIGGKEIAKGKCILTHTTRKSTNDLSCLLYKVLVSEQDHSFRIMVYKVLEPEEPGTAYSCTPYAMLLNLGVPLTAWLSTILR